MLLKILLLLFPAILLYVPMAFYMKDGHRMAAFHQRMALSPNARKCYMLVLLFILLVFHYLHHSVMNDIMALLPSTVITMCLFSYRLTEQIFHIIKRHMRMFGVMVLATTLITLPVHGLFPTVVTLGFLLHASIFYPSKKIQEVMKSGMPTNGNIIRLYY